jgi:hypothetical protein
MTSSARAGGAVDAEAVGSDDPAIGEGFMTLLA